MWSNSDDEEIKKILGPSISLGFPGGSSGKESACNVGDLGLIPGLGRSPGGDPLEEGMAIHYSILAWRIPWTKESGRLQSMGLQRVGQDWATKHTSSISLEKTHFVPFYGWVIFHCVCGGCVCVCVWHLLYTFICWWAPTLLPCPGYCRQCCFEPRDACVFWKHDFLGIYAQEWDCWITCRSS